MKRFENRGEKAMRAKHKALRCAETRPESPTQEVVNLSEGARAQAEAEEMMKPAGEIVSRPAKLSTSIREIWLITTRLNASITRWRNRI